MNFKNNFKRIREKNHLTQEDIAREIGISRQSVSKWENGVNEPDLETIEKLCFIFHCSPNDLIGSNENTEDYNRKLKNNDIQIAINIILMTLVVIGLVIAVTFFIYLIVKKQNYLAEPSHQGMSPSLGLGMTFLQSDLEELTRKLAINTYTEEVVNANPNLVLSVRSSILGKYTLSGDLYWYNTVDIVYVKSNDHFYLLIPIVFCSFSLVAHIIVLRTQFKERMELLRVSLEH